MTPPTPHSNPLPSAYNKLMILLCMDTQIHIQKQPSLDDSRFVLQNKYEISVQDTAEVPQI